VSFVIDCGGGDVGRTAGSKPYGLPGLVKPGNKVLELVEYGILEN
jgi:hypothetical protein